MAKKGGFDFKKRDLGLIGKKKKNVLIIGAVVIMFIALITSVIMSLDFKAIAIGGKKNIEEIADLDEGIQGEAEIKEDWAIEVENKFERLEETQNRNLSEMGTSLKNDIIDSNKFQMQEITLLIKKLDNKIGALEGRNAALKSELKTQKTLNEQKLKNLHAKLQSDLNSVNNRIDDASLLPPPPIEGVKNSSSQNADIFKSMKIKPIQSGTKRSGSVGRKVDFNVSSYENNIKEIMAINETKEAEKTEKAKPSFEITTGFTEAYMITGAYATLFGETDTKHAVPVLMESEGDLIMPNDTIGSVDKCMLIGTAIGNASSATVDVRLEKMTCILDSGTKMIEGPIKGWVVSENGSPGLPATMIYRAGQYISRMIASGVLEGLSQGFINSASGYSAGNSNAVVGGVYSGASSGVSNAFSKLADFYLELAEATLPTLYVKGGRSVSLMIEGGDTFKTRDVNLLDVRDMDTYLGDFIEEKDDE